MTANALALVLSSLTVVAQPNVRTPLNSSTPGCRETSITHLRIAINAVGSLSPNMTAEIRRVVEQVWAPYGVGVRWSTAPISAVPSDADLVILLQLEPMRSAPGSLGAVAFGPDGPSPIIRLSASTATKWIRHSRFPSLNDQQLLKLDQVTRAIGSLLGYAAAHELGHVLLATRSHTAAGLMASGYSVDAFSLDLARGRLDVANEERLAERLSGASKCGGGPGGAVK